MKDKITAASIFLGAIWRFAERICAQMVTFVVSLVLARLLTPEDYGVVAIAMILVTVFNVFATSGFGAALIQKKETDDSDYSTILIFGILFTGALYMLLFAIAPLVASIYQTPVLTPLLRIMALNLPFAAVNSVQQAYVSRRLIFRKFFFATLVGTIVSAVVGICMAYLGFGVWALAAQYLVNGAVSVIALGISLRWWPGFHLSYERLHGMFGFGWKILCSDLLATIYTQLRSLTIGKFCSAGQLAYYERGQQIPHIFVTNVGTAISSVLFPTMSAQQNDENALADILRRSVQISSYIMFPMMAGLAAISEPLIRLLLTDKWIPVIPYMQLSCLTMAVEIWGVANQQVIKAQGKGSEFLKWEIIRKTIALILLAISIPFGAYSIAMSGCIYALIAVAINANLNRSIGYGFMRQLKDALPSLMISLIMMGLVSMLNFVMVGTIGRLVLQISAGILSYILLSILSKNAGFYLVREALDGILRRKIR